MEFEELKIEIPIEEADDDDNDELQLPPKKYENKAGSFVIGFDINSQEAVEKRDRRRKRFGVIEEEKLEKEQEDDTDKDESCNSLPKEIPKIPQGESRLDALLVYGIQNLNTKDVFDYFQDYGPGSIEWIDDYSCNVVWDDDNSAAIALECLGKDIESDESDTSNTNKKAWKAGPPCKKAGCRLMMRLSTKKDKKQPGAAKRSMFYLVHGYPGQNRGQKQGQKGLVSKSRKRKIMQEQERARHKSSGEPDVAFIDKLDAEEDEKMDIDEPALKVVVKNDRTTEDADYDDSSLRLRMRMRADDQDKEPSKIKDRLQERLQPDIESNITTSSGDLRERLKSRRKHGFDTSERPSLSIEIREEKT